MNRVSAGFLALLPLVCLAAIAVAQDSKTVNASTLDCGSSASRTSKPCEDQVVAHTEQELTTTIKLPAIENDACDTTLRFEFSQRGTLARLQGTIENRTCAASTGEYSVAVRIRDAAGESKTLEFRESWQRVDDQPVTFKSDYPIGDNVDLINVRARPLRCTCAGDSAPQPNGRIGSAPSQSTDARQ
jgi:hypothetical protein